MDIELGYNPTSRGRVYFISIGLNMYDAISFDNTIKGHRVMKQVLIKTMPHKLAVKKYGPDTGILKTIVLKNRKFIKVFKGRWIDNDLIDIVNGEVWKTVWIQKIHPELDDKLLYYSRLISDNYKNLNKFQKELKEFEIFLSKLIVKFRTKDILLKEILFEIKRLAENPDNVKDYSRFHKDGKKHIGLASNIARKLYAEKFKQVKHLDKKEIFDLCERLLECGDDSCRGMAFDWAFRIKKQYTKEDFAIFEKWLDKYVDTWGSCDDFCTHAFGYHLFVFPESIPKIHQWTKSINKWKRRASAVIFIYPARKNKYLDEFLKIAKSLLLDEEDLVQKAYGWMLKEASNANQKMIFDFVMKYKSSMPRTALRYAIEKMPANLKRQAMMK